MTPSEISQRYLDLNFVRSLEEQDQQLVEGSAFVAEAWVTDGDGRRTDSVTHGEPVDLWADIEATEALNDAEIRLAVENELGTQVFAASTLEFGRRLQPFRPGERRRLRVRFDNQLVSDTYHVGVLVRSRTAPGEVYAVSHRAARFNVVGGEHVGGLYDIEHELELEPVKEPTPG